MIVVAVVVWLAFIVCLCMFFAGARDDAMTASDRGSPSPRSGAVIGLPSSEPDRVLPRSRSGLRLRDDDDGNPPAA